LAISHWIAKLYCFKSNMIGRNVQYHDRYLYVMNGNRIIRKLKPERYQLLRTNYILNANINNEEPFLRELISLCERYQTDRNKKLDLHKNFVHTLESHLGNIMELYSNPFDSAFRSYKSKFPEDSVFEYPAV